MISKKTADRKRSRPPCNSDKTRQFQKDWERLERSGRYDLQRLKEVMLLLIANEGPLGPEWFDHPLTGAWSDHREYHVGGDFLLIYRLDTSVKEERVIFVRAGTHNDLFE